MLGSWSNTTAAITYTLPLRYMLLWKIRIYMDMTIQIKKEVIRVAKNRSKCCRKRRQKEVARKAARKMAKAKVVCEAKKKVERMTRVITRIITEPTLVDIPRIEDRDYGWILYPRQAVKTCRVLSSQKRNDGRCIHGLLNMTCAHCVGMVRMV
jgi:hypothetical protein